ncbi:hypothetical protein AUEXF2481DRAFT_584525 [Aureobasidium subglaciale EXF-2481]|uniref:Uncharacterized protein n=1 Tax=Aureobasidium subglaciale (strain EXF-2481) TaxID=1043005 RepID=A0A074ZF40_AURSE|nr:uncharacterized protein AUEXF2481DRAFT_584525 [Aureobasidium subglaciale EXF-2481]KEQ97241.1 hypothetical protein AUEXF2481DRAFT_584525 [Aureobasidium subglaciale EXF-2481]
MTAVRYWAAMGESRPWSPRRSACVVVRERLDEENANGMLLGAAPQPTPKLNPQRRPAIRSSNVRAAVASNHVGEGNYVSQTLNAHTVNTSCINHHFVIAVLALCYIPSNRHVNVSLCLIFKLPSGMPCWSSSHLPASMMHYSSCRKTTSQGPLQPAVSRVVPRL